MAELKVSQGAPAKRSESATVRLVDLAAELAGVTAVLRTMADAEEEATRIDNADALHMLSKLAGRINGDICLIADEIDRAEVAA